MDIHQQIMESVKSVLSEKIDEEVLKKVDTKELRKKLFNKLTKKVFYQLFKEGKVRLPPGFGTVSLKSIREKEKKVYNKREKTMNTFKVKGSKIVYRPGQKTKQFL